LAQALSVSQLSSESFYKPKEGRPSDEEGLSRELEPEDASKAGEPDTDALDDLEMVRAMSSRQKPQNAVLAPSVVPVGPRKPQENEAELLVKRVCESLDGKFGSVDAAFLSMSAKWKRSKGAEGAEGPESPEDQEDRNLVELRSCLVDSGVGYKDATLLLQAMRPALGGALPTLQHVANSLRPGQLLQFGCQEHLGTSWFGRGPRGPWPSQPWGTTKRFRHTLRFQLARQSTKQIEGPFGA